MTKYIGAITGEMQQLRRHSLEGSHLSRSVSCQEVSHRLVTGWARFPKWYLHDAVPVVARSHAEEREKSHAKVLKVRVLTQALARVLLVALCRSN